MNNDNYVIDEKRNMAWGNPSDALAWYRAELDRVEADRAGLIAWIDGQLADCRHGGGMSMSEATFGERWLVQVRQKIAAP